MAKDWSENFRDTAFSIAEQRRLRARENLANQIALQELSMKQESAPLERRLKEAQVKKYEAEAGSYDTVPSLGAVQNGLGLQGSNNATATQEDRRGTLGMGSPNSMGDSPFVRVAGKVQKNPYFVSPKDAMEMEEKNQLKADQEESLRTSAQGMLGSIKEAKKGSKYFGPLGGLPSIAAPSSIPILGTAGGSSKIMGEYGERKVWESNVNKILSQKVVDLMAEMKRVSKTGATGFGALSNRELSVLQQASTALNKGLPPEEAVKYLEEIEGMYQKVLGGGQKFGQLEQPQVPEWVPQDFDYASAVQAYGSPEAVLEELRKSGHVR